MEYIKRVISLENSTSRVLNNNYGEVTATTFNVPIQLIQKFDDIGLYTDMNYLAAPPLVNPPDFYEEGNMPVGVTVDMYYTTNNPVVTGTTTDKVTEISGYYLNDRFRVGVNQCHDTSDDVVGTFCKDNNGNWLRFDGVTSYNPTTKILKYILGGNADPTTGNYLGGGIEYTTEIEKYITRKPDGSAVISANDTSFDKQDYLDAWQNTFFSFTTSGRNSLNTTLSALTKEEEFLGVVFPQEVESQVFIDRGAENIFEKHLIMSEIKTINEVDNYRGGYLVYKAEGDTE
jgi:hypothetical protein